MLSKSISEEKDDNKLVRCENCRQDILANKMFLHEGFCQRNNVFCEHCQEVYLKDEYKEHIEELKNNLTTKKVEFYSDSKKSTSNEEENPIIENSITTIIPSPTIEYVQMPLIEQISISDPIFITENGQIVSNKNKNEYLLPYLGISLSQNNFFSGEEFMYGENQNFQNYPYIETQVKSPIYPKEQYNNIYNNMIGYNDYDYLLNNTIKRNNTEIFNRNIKLNTFDDYNLINNNLINYNHNYITYSNNENLNEYNNKKANKIKYYFKREKIPRKEFNSEDKVYKRNKKYDSPKDKLPRKTIFTKFIKKSPKNRTKKLINYISFDGKKPTDNGYKLLTEKRVFKKSIIKDKFKSQSISDKKTKIIKKCGYCQTYFEDEFLHFKECKKINLSKSNNNKKNKKIIKIKDKKINDKLLLTEKLKNMDIDEFGIEENNKKILNRNFTPFLNISNLNSTINPTSPIISNEDLNKKEKPKKIKTKKKQYKRKSPIINYRDNFPNKTQKPKKIIIKLKKTKVQKVK